MTPLFPQVWFILYLIGLEKTLATVAVWRMRIIADRWARRWARRREDYYYLIGIIKAAASCGEHQLERLSWKMLSWSNDSTHVNCIGVKPLR